MSARKKKRPRPKPHRFGQFNVTRIKVVNWRLPLNRDDEVVWGTARDDDQRRENRRTR